MLPLTKKCYENIFECSIKIQKLYDKLYELDINGKCDSSEYKRTVEYIKTLKYFENIQYDRLFTNFDSFLEFNNCYMEKFYSIIESYDSIDLIYDKRDLMLFQRIDTIFNRRLALSNYYDKLMELNSEPEISVEIEDIELEGKELEDAVCQLVDRIVSPFYSKNDDEIIYEERPNYIMFNMFTDSKFYKNTIKLLKEKLNNYSYNDSNYRILVKYYYGLLYMQESIENMFLNKENDGLNIFPNFINNLPDSTTKTSYLKILEESYILNVICILKGIILKEFPNLDNYYDKQIEELYYIQLENLVTLSPNAIIGSLEQVTMNTIDQIYQLNQDVTIEKSSVIQKTKTILNKVKRNDN